MKVPGPHGQVDPRPLRSNPGSGFEVAPTLGPPIKGDCGRRHSILHACKNHTSSENRSMEDTKRRRSNERPGVSQRYSQLRSVTVVAVSPLRGRSAGGVAPPACICATVFLPCHSEARERARQSADAALRRPNLWFGPAKYCIARIGRARCRGSGTRVAER